MNWLRVFLSRLRALVRGGELDRDLQEQINAHLEEATDEYVQQGLSHKEARCAALRSFGGVVQAQEAHRDMRSFGWLEDARRDVRYTLGALQRTPGFAVVAILTLALAIGAATAIFSVIDAALVRPVPYQKPEEIVAIDVGEAFDQRMAASATDIEGWRTATGVFARIGMGDSLVPGPSSWTLARRNALRWERHRRTFSRCSGLLPFSGVGSLPTTGGRGLLWSSSSAITTGRHACMARGRSSVGRCS